MEHVITDMIFLEEKAGIFKRLHNDHVGVGACVETAGVALDQGEECNDVVFGMGIEKQLVSIELSLQATGALPHNDGSHSGVDGLVGMDYLFHGIIPLGPFEV